MYAKNAHAQNRKNPKSWTPISMWWDHCDVPLAGVPMSRRLVALGLPKKMVKGVFVERDVWAHHASTAPSR